MNSNNSNEAIFQTVAAIAGFAISAIVFLWDRVMLWAKETFLPFVGKYLPLIRDDVENAFKWIDKNIAVPIRRGIKAAWEKVRQYLLKMAMYFEQQSSNKWVRKTTSYVIKTLESKQVIKQTIEQDIDWDDLPPEIRQSWMKSNKNNFEIDYTDLKDKNSDSDTLEMVN